MAGAVRASDDPAADLEVLRSTLDEVERGKAAGPRELDDLVEEFSGLWMGAVRRGLKQGLTYRSIEK